LSGKGAGKPAPGIPKKEIDEINGYEPIRSRWSFTGTLGFQIKGQAESRRATSTGRFKQR
jgi:hypothetical protein